MTGTGTLTEFAEGAVNNWWVITSECVDWLPPSAVICMVPGPMRCSGDSLFRCATKLLKQQSAPEVQYVDRQPARAPPRQLKGSTRRVWIFRFTCKINK